MQPGRVVLVPHTHWDREWYEPFDVFEGRLVGMMNGLIDLFASEPRFAHFHLDGQATVIDDYLAVRPEREPHIRRLIGEGRISIGPWYTQMDEFLVSGESLIRNLEWGLRRASDFGVAPTAGYLPDQFGHVGQMPQILRNAGLTRAVVWRGVPSAIDRTAFWWEAPDGSRVLTEYLAFGYSVGMSISGCEDVESLSTALRQAVELLAPYSPRDRLLITVGSDHFGPPPQLAGLLEDVRRRDGLSAEIGSIEGYLDGPDPDGIPVHRGELRSAARAFLLPNVYSNRIRQKDMRARVEANLERVAEPLAALVPGFEWPEEDLRRAWRLLLWNGAHDSVCGCSVDKVAADVDERYEEAEAIARDVVDLAMAALAARVRTPGLVVFNPSPFERHGIPPIGWAVNPSIPTEEEVEIRIEGSSLVAGDVRFRLVDEGDVGDLYNWCPTPDSPPRGPERIDIEPGYELMTKSGLRVQVKPTVVATWPGLRVELQAHRRPGERYLRLSGMITNERPDHRLRLHVELSGPAEGSTALAPFEIVSRPRTSEGGTEVPSPMWPARGAVLAGGAALFMRHVFEYEVVQDPPELAVTLLRAVGTISRSGFPTRPWPAGPDIATPNAQMLGDTPFSVAVVGGLDPADLPAEWERIYLLGASAEASGGGDLPDRGSLLEIDGAELSSVRRVDGVVEVRVWNPSEARRLAKVGHREVPLEPARIATVSLRGPAART